MKHVDSGKVIKAGSEAAKVMHKLADDARKITSKINSEYHTSKGIR